VQMVEMYASLFATLCLFCLPRKATAFQQNGLNYDNTSVTFWLKTLIWSSHVDFMMNLNFFSLAVGEKVFWEMGLL